MKSVHPTVVAAALCLTTTYTFAQQGDVCGRIVDHGLNNITVKTSTYSLADRTYWDFCDEKWSSMTDTKRAEFGVTIKQIPFSAKGSKESTEQVHTRFCGTHKTSTDINSNEAQLTRKMHDRAIDAWRSCIAMTASGMFIDYRVPTNQKYADIFLKYTGSSGSTNFNGVEATGFTCASNGVAVGPGSKFTITAAETAIRCDRQFITQDIGGVTSEYFPDGGITVKTDAGNGSTEFVAMIDGPARNRFGQVDTQIAGVRAGLDSLSTNLQAWAAADAARGNYVGWGTPSGTTTCPAGQYAVGFQYWGAPGNIKYCVGCASGFQIMCRPLNTANVNPTVATVADGSK